MPFSVKNGVRLWAGQGLNGQKEKIFDKEKVE